MMDNETFDGSMEGRDDEELSELNKSQNEKDSSDIEEKQKTPPDLMDQASNPEENPDIISEDKNAPIDMKNRSESPKHEGGDAGNIDPLNEPESQEENPGTSAFEDDIEFDQPEVDEKGAGEEVIDLLGEDEKPDTTESYDKEIPQQSTAAENENAGGDIENHEAPPSIEEEEAASQPESIDAQEQSSDWWGDVPFTPMDTLEEEEETQPVRVSNEGSDKLEEEVENVSGAETRVIPLHPLGSSSTETRVIPTGTERPTSDDIPTIPPPNVPPGWVPENPNLPRSVSQVDNQATRVTPAAYQGSSRKLQDTDKIPLKKKSKKEKSGPASKRPKKVKETRKTGGCLLRAFLFFIFLLILAALVAGSIGIYQYFRISSSLPDVTELQERAAKFETTRILDRDGHLLYEIIDPNAGRRTYVPLEEISPELIAATIATEDKDFFTNPGFDLWGMSRALIQNYTAGEIQSGASTITQQLARALLLDPTERYEQTYARKAREIVLAYEITRQYSKEEILELYLNENFYGNNSYGVQAASETYFNTSAGELNLWQASFLAGLPQGPSIYDIYTNREATLYRQRSVLVLMYELSSERGCIGVGMGRPDVCVSYEEATQAGIDLTNYDFPELTFNMRYPHWVVYVKSLLEEQFDPQTIYRSGFTVYTTLDPNLQREGQRIVAEQLSKLQENNASNGALIAMDPQTGEILAMVGSADFYNEEIDGQVNMVLSQTRQPGSAIKPLTYVAAFEKGWTPSTLIWDVPTAFPPSLDPNDTNPPYEPVNYDGKFHGPVTLRSALANSYNIPAVKALQYVGIYDDPTTPATGEGLVSFAERLGITSLTRPDYGLSLTLGGGEVSLKELTAAYAVFANQGRKMPSVAITKIVDHTGNVIYEYEPPVGDQVIRAEHAYLISSILSDKSARVPMFGTNPVINLSFPAAAKTGTTNDFRDNWTMGYTPDLVVGAWVGNTDYTPMVNTTGLSGAGPIWAEFMTYAIGQIGDGAPSPFTRPAGIVDRVICAISGTEPSEWCPQQRSEIFASDQLPKPESEDLWVRVKIDTWTGLLESIDCNEFTQQAFALNVEDPWARKWIKDDPRGQTWAEDMGFSTPLFFAPERACRADDPQPVIDLVGLSDGLTINTNPLEINGIINATDNFDYYQIEWGEGSDPVTWNVLVERQGTPQDTSGLLYEWDLEDVEPGIITLKFYVHSTKDTFAEKLISLNIQLPTPTPTETPTETPTPTTTPSPTITPTPVNTSTSTSTPPPTTVPNTPTPTFTPSLTPTPGG